MTSGDSSCHAKARLVVTKPVHLNSVFVHYNQRTVTPNTLSCAMFVKEDVFFPWSLTGQRDVGTRISKSPYFSIYFTSSTRESGVFIQLLHHFFPWEAYLRGNQWNLSKIHDLMGELDQLALCHCDVESLSVCFSCLRSNIIVLSVYSFHFLSTLYVFVSYVVKMIIIFYNWT